MNNKKKMNFLDYFILKIIVAATFFLLYLKPGVFEIAEYVTADAIVICRGAALLMSIFTMSQVFDAIYKASIKRN